MLDIIVLVALGAIADERTPSSLFKDVGRVEVTATGMTVVRIPQQHVLVARIDDDGGITTACAASEEAVHALLAEKKPETR